MKSLNVNFDEAAQTIDFIETASSESWDAVCERFENDVRRIKDVSDQDEYTALYACYDENNRPVYYLVEEDEALMKLRRKTFLSKLGHLKP
jgi:hypothetical protein